MTETNAPTKVEFWYDPACPWCWMTSRWLVSIKDERNLDITWEPISLFFKNHPPLDDPFHEPTKFTLGLLRVAQAIGDDLGNDSVERFYTEVGTRIHHNQSFDFTAVEALEALTLDSSYASAFHDESLDPIIRKRMDSGLFLTGDEVGTPIVALRSETGEHVALFGPVISRLGDLESRLKLWDAYVTMASTAGFWELKRTRTEDPQFDTI